jgi:hypothetical protein
MNTAPLGFTSAIAKQHIDEMHRKATQRRLARALAEKTSVPAPLWVRPQRAPALRGQPAH